MKENISKLTTEQSSHFEDLDKMSVLEILEGINQEDKTVPLAVEKEISSIEALVKVIVEKMSLGGRLFYIGAGTSGRLGIVDASECPPTYGVPPDWVIGLMAGGDQAIRKAVEKAEDDFELAWKDLIAYNISEKDVLVGIAASGRTPYVIGGLRTARAHGIQTGCIVCNRNSAVSQEADFPIEVEVGPEFVTGSTRMKSGTAQKLVLNMISTSVMIQLGRVKGNRMVDMQLSNQKLEMRAIQMVMEAIKVSEESAQEFLKLGGSVRKAIDLYNNGKKS